MIAKVLPLVRKERPTYTAHTAVFHGLRLYGEATLGELFERMAEIRDAANHAKVGPNVPALTRNQISDALGWLKKRDFVVFERVQRVWMCKTEMVIPARWKDTFQS